MTQAAQIPAALEATLPSFQTAPSTSAEPSTAPAVARSGRIPVLDVLRAFAILWLLFYHMMERYVSPEGPRFLVRFAKAGYLGVDLFFVLSGYLIARICLHEAAGGAAVSPRAFWYRRWMRTLPAYYATLFFIVGTDILLSPDQPFERLWSYLIFVQTYFGEFSSLRFSWSWSLCVEELFYLTLPLALLVVRRLTGAGIKASLRYTALAGLLLSVVSRSFIYWNDPSEAGYWACYSMPHTRLDGIALGLVIATLPTLPSGTLTRLALAVPIALLALLVSGVLHPWLQFHHFLYSALTFTLLTYLCVSDERLRRLRVPAAGFVADISYSLYLVNPIFLKAIERVLLTMPSEIQAVAFVVGSLLGAWLLRRLVEVPFLALRDQS